MDDESILLAKVVSADIDPDRANLGKYDEE